MNRELLQLAWQGLKARKRSTLLLLLVLFLSLCLAVVTLSVTGSMAETNTAYRLDTYGQWYLGILSGVEEDRTFLEEQEWLDRLGTARNYGTVTTEFGTFGVGTVDEELVQLGHIGLEAGRLPQAPGEIALESGLLNALGYYDAKPGDEIQLSVTFSCVPVGAGEVTVTGTFSLCGVLREYTYTWNLTQNVEGHLLNSAVITAEDGEALRAAASQQLEPLRQTAREVVALQKEQDEEVSLYWEARTRLGLKDPNVMYFFAVALGQEKTAWQDVRAYLKTARWGTHADREPSVNQAALPVQQDTAVNYIYTALVFAVALLAVVCIYVIQLQKQVRQITLFRSIGITKGQLRTMLLYETLMVCLPAFLLGVAGGALGTRLVLRLAVYSGSVPVRVVIPYRQLGWLLGVWLLGVLITRLVLFQIALRAPLTGRMTLERRKLGASRRVRQLLVGALATLLCACLLFTAALTTDALDGLAENAALPSYQITVKYSEYVEVTIDQAWMLEQGNSPENNVIRMPIAACTPEELQSFLDAPECSVQFFNLTEQTLEDLRRIPGVNKVEGYGIIDVALMEDGLEDSALYADCWTADRTDSRYLYLTGGNRVNFLSGRAVQVYVLPEGEWATYFTGEEVDLEAFRSGETVVMAFPVDDAGGYVLDFPLLEEDGYYSSYDLERRSYDSPGLEEGDRVTLRFYDNTLKRRIRVCPLNTVTVEVGHIFTYPISARQVGPVSITAPYTIICSQSFVERAMDAMPHGYSINHYRTGNIPALNRGFDYASVYTDLNAGYLATDAAITHLCDAGGLALQNDMATHTAAAQALLQQLILALAVGGSAALVLLLIMANTLTLETQREGRTYGILQSLGMSRRQLRLRLAGAALLRGACSAVLGWELFRLWAAFAGQTGEQRLVPVWALAGAGLVTAVSLFAKRSLFREDLMAKLRDEQ